MNERYSVDNQLSGRYRNVFLKEPARYVVRGSYWNNDFHFYGTFVDTFLNNSALMIKTIGNITRQPGGIIDVSIDRGQKDMVEESP